MCGRQNQGVYCTYDKGHDWLENFLNFQYKTSIILLNYTRFY